MGEKNMISQQQDMTKLRGQAKERIPDLAITYLIDFIHNLTNKNTKPLYEWIQLRNIPVTN